MEHLGKTRYCQARQCNYRPRRTVGLESFFFSTARRIHESACTLCNWGSAYGLDWFLSWRNVLRAMLIPDQITVRHGQLREDSRRIVWKFSDAFYLDGPTSDILSYVLLAIPMGRQQAPLRVLEVGPGTGGTTARLRRPSLQLRVSQFGVTHSVMFPQQWYQRPRKKEKKRFVRYS
jgi:hypothetical protein